MKNPNYIILDIVWSIHILPFEIEKSFLLFIKLCFLSFPGSSRLHQKVLYTYDAGSDLRKAALSKLIGLGRGHFVI